jgi:SNF2 family DNA or RNA helicase
LRLFLLGDEMGVGKTLQGVMMMATNRHQPGMNLVVCPKGVCATWVETIHCAFEEVRALIPWIATASRDVDIRMDKWLTEYRITPCVQFCWMTAQ